MVVGKGIVTFGKVDNQISHAFRHIDKLGLGRKLVQSVIQSSVNEFKQMIIPGKPFNKIIKIGDNKIQYTAYKLEDGTINIGRIHGVDN